MPFGFSIGARLASSVSASFMKVNKDLYAMKGPCGTCIRSKATLIKISVKGLSIKNPLTMRRRWRKCIRLGWIESTREKYSIFIYSNVY